MPDGFALAALKPLVIPASMAGPFLVLLGVVGGGLLLVGLYAAWRARHPKVRKPPRKTFDAGRRVARLKRARTVEQALAALGSTPVGNVLQAREVPQGFDIVVERRRGQSCAQAAGYLAGLFESVWARDVAIEHSGCAGDRGGECRYLVSPAGRTAAAAATRGSASAGRRSPPARPGAG